MLPLSDQGIPEANKKSYQVLNNRILLGGFPQLYMADNELMIRCSTDGCNQMKAGNIQHLPVPLFISTLAIIAIQKLNLL